MQKRTRILGPMLALAGVVTLAGCGGDSQGDTDKADAGEAPQQSESANTAQQTAPEPARTSEPEPACANCGTVISIQKRDTTRSNTSKEAVGGAVLGAVAGVMAGSSQFSGDEETIAEVVGGLAGAAAGHQAGKRAFTKSYYVVRIDMESGGTRAINVPDVSSLSVGQSVRVKGNTIIPR